MHLVSVGYVQCGYVQCGVCTVYNYRMCSVGVCSVGCVRTATSMLIAQQSDAMYEVCVTGPIVYMCMAINYTYSYVHRPAAYIGHTQCGLLICMYRYNVDWSRMQTALMQLNQII